MKNINFNKGTSIWPRKYTKGMNVSNYFENYLDFSLSLFDCRARASILLGVEFLVLKLLIMIVIVIVIVIVKVIG